ncbi:kinase-like domain-containing protein [Rhizophagus clarus]|uniref:Kinase-like domain-containing protein n=1 Tax=Rhizophagus clarus TaxID=94130 RepID=A0A8H3QQ55_9GLOM|nr:kinase-like domain-containing protein [Rhizophagus clarus]
MNGNIMKVVIVQVKLFICMDLQRIKILIIIWWAHDLELSLSICKGERPEIIEYSPQCYINLMKKCWNEDPSKRPSTSEVKKIIRDWIYCPVYYEIKEELKSDIMEFINAPIEHKNLTFESHPQAYYTSRILDFTSERLNKILESECFDCIVDNTKSLDGTN